jgi:membrane protein implicated in regulation of membrane protease activity
VTGVLNEPAIILACVTLAAVLVVVEVALPTLGFAGTTAAVAAVAAGVGIDRAEATWWPLIGSAIAVVLWSALVLGRRRSFLAEATALAAYAAGSLGFAGANTDGPAFAVGAACTLALALAFPPLHRGATRLLGAQAKVGMESLVGQVARVDRWAAGSGVVMLHGTRWNATSDPMLSLGEGDEVVVTGSHGNTVEVAAGGAALHPPPPPTLQP